MSEGSISFLRKLWEAILILGGPIYMVPELNRRRIADAIERNQDGQ